MIILNMYHQPESEQELALPATCYLAGRRAGVLLWPVVCPMPAGGSAVKGRQRGRWLPVAERASPLTALQAAGTRARRAKHAPERPGKRKIEGGEGVDGKITNVKSMCSRRKKVSPPTGRVSGLLGKGSNVLSRLENDAGDDLERKLNEEEKQRFNNKAPS